MYTYDFDGDMEFYQKQLARKGITKEMFDMEQFIGLSARELQNIVDGVSLVKKGE